MLSAAGRVRLAEQAGSLGRSIGNLAAAWRQRRRQHRNDGYVPQRSRRLVAGRNAGFRRATGSHHVTTPPPLTELVGRQFSLLTVLPYNPSYLF